MLYEFNQVRNQVRKQASKQASKYPYTSSLSHFLTSPYPPNFSCLQLLRKCVERDRRAEHIIVLLFVEVTIPRSHSCCESLDFEELFAKNGK
jgi:hypothetical protein